MESPLISLLKRMIVVLDGATGTELIARGLSAGECPEHWNLLHPERVKEVHRKYYGAGSTIVLSNTFGGSRLKLEPYGLQDHVGEINRAGAMILKEVCPVGCFAGGDIGPTGKLLKPTGDFEPEDFQEIFEEQAFALQDGGVDLIAIETMYDLREAAIALRAALKTGLPVFVTLPFIKKKKGFFTMMGDKPDECFRTLKEDGAAAVGTNCSLDHSQMVEFVESLSKASLSGPFIVKPNAGQPRLEGSTTVYDANPDEYVEAVTKMISAGASMVGGCCGTSPLFISKLAHELKRKEITHAKRTQAEDSDASRDTGRINL